MRLINADDAPLYLNKAGVKQIKRMPTVDAVAIRHGNWKLVKRKNIWDNFTEVYECSECGEFTIGNRGITTPTNYCPNCGAEMDS